MSFVKQSVIPGFWFGLGYSLIWLTLIVLMPLIALVLYACHIRYDELWRILTNRELLCALKLSLYTAFIAAFSVSILGSLLAWVLVRYRFPGSKLMDVMIDLPFALPTAVAGIALTSLYDQNGFLGSLLPFKVAYTPLGIMIALIFVTLPFVVRTLQPIIKDIPKSIEEAAFSLGANSFQLFLYVLFPALFPAWLTGFSLSMARSLGEYGSIVFISANIPYKTEILPLLIVSKLDQFDYVGATVVSILILLVSFAFLLLINLIQNYVKPNRILWILNRFHPLALFTKDPL